MEIRMARGDLETRTIRLKTKSGEPYGMYPNDIYFTVKKNASDRNYIFQKRLSDDTIVYVDTGEYRFSILPEDTDGLPFGTYEFDIEIVKHDTTNVKKTFCGTLILSKEVTHHYNEVSGNG